MKISVFSLSGLNPGKHNVKDPRLEAVNKIVNAKKLTYVQVELVAEDAAIDADAILAAGDSLTDLVLKDLEFVETRLSRTEDQKEKALLEKIKAGLEKEQLIAKMGLAAEELAVISNYGLLTAKPVIAAEEKDLEDPNSLLARCLAESGYISFFTAGEKDTRAWLIKKGASAWEASGAIHSDIQRGFIRAEIISLEDYLACGGENAAKQAGKMRLEPKDYVMQDADLANFRFNK